MYLLPLEKSTYGKAFDLPNGLRALGFGKRLILGKFSQCAAIATRGGVSAGWTPSQCCRDIDMKDDSITSFNRLATIVPLLN